MRVAAFIVLSLLQGLTTTASAQPQAALSQTNTAPLPVPGKFLGVVEGGLVIAADEGEGGLLLLLDPVTLEIGARHVLADPVLALAAREDRAELAVLTGRNGAVTLNHFGAGLQPLGAAPVGMLEQPSLSLTADGRSVIAASGGETYFAVFDERGLRMDIRKTYEASLPSSAAWISNDVAFFNAAIDMRLSAVNLETGSSYSEYQIFFKDGRAVLPFSVAPLLADRSCRGEYQNEFLLANAELGLITFLRADTGRSVLRQIAEATVDMREPVGNRRAALIGSSCNGAAVWLAGANSRTLSQFSVVREGDRLEQVGTASLPGPANALTLSWDGQSGWVSLQEQPLLIRFELSESEPPPLPGDETVRELQRLLSEKGYPVGTIDGVIGARTRSATVLIGRSTGSKLDISTDQGLITTIETLKELPASKY